jgi:malonyl-ACP O-methyltransferase BioC
MTKKVILHHFSQQAHSYEQYAMIQKHSAAHLARLIRQRPIPGSFLEIGCGTGLLAKQLGSWQPKVYLATDLSSKMIDICQQQNLPNSFLVMDGEQIALDCMFDLVASNFTFQWFRHPQQSLLELLSYGRCLAFAVPGPATFKEWSQACALRGLKSGVLSFLGQEDYHTLFKSHQMLHLQTEYLRLSYPHWLGFWKDIKKIGAHTSHPFYLRQNLPKSLMLEGPVTITYEIIYCVVER